MLKSAVLSIRNMGLRANCWKIIAIRLKSWPRPCWSGKPLMPTRSTTSWLVCLRVNPNLPTSRCRHAIMAHPEVHPRPPCSQCKRHECRLLEPSYYFYERERRENSVLPLVFYGLIFPYDFFLRQIRTQFITATCHGHRQRHARLVFRWRQI